MVSTASKSVPGNCVCGAVQLEIDFPAFWAWHDHSGASRHAQGAAYATYVGSWRSRFRILAGEGALTRFEAPEAGTARSFCARCGTPVLYERARSIIRHKLFQQCFDNGLQRLGGHQLVR